MVAVNLLIPCPDQGSPCRPKVRYIQYIRTYTVRCTVQQVPLVDSTQSRGMVMQAAPCPGVRGRAAAVVTFLHLTPLPKQERGLFVTRLSKNEILVLRRAIR